MPSLRAINSVSGGQVFTDNPFDDGPTAHLRGLGWQDRQTLFSREHPVASRLNPYLSFSGNARQALEFYQGVFGGSTTLNAYGEFEGSDASIADQIMHGQLETDLGFTLMCADTPPGNDLQPGNNIAVSLSGDDTDALRGYWQGLSEGGTVAVPLEKQMWGDEFGMCVDRFGTQWMVNIAGK